MDSVDPTWLLQSKLLLPKGNKISSIYKMKKPNFWLDKHTQDHIFSSMCLIVLMTWHHRHAQYMLRIENNFYFIFKFPFSLRCSWLLSFCSPKSKISSYLGGEFSVDGEASLIAESKRGKMSSGHINLWWNQIVWTNSASLQIHDHYK